MEPQDRPSETLQIRKYLLRSSSEEDHSRIEERLFTDEPFCDELELAEDELIEAYLRGELSAAEKEQFESQFLDSPRHRHQTASARALRKAFALRTRRALSPGWSKLLALFDLTRPYCQIAYAVATMVVITGAAVWSFVAASRATSAARNFENQLAAANSQLDSLRQQVAHLSAGAQVAEAPAALSFVLLPDKQNRGAEIRDLQPSRTLSIPTAAQMLRLTLRSEAARKQGLYRVAIADASGAEVWSSMVPRSTFTPQLDVEVPAIVFQRSGAYAVTSGPAQTATGIADAEVFVFRVVKQ